VLPSSTGSRHLRRSASVRRTAGGTGRGCLTARVVIYAGEESERGPSHVDRGSFVVDIRREDTDKSENPER
jgi:hypothetical protein